MRIGLIGCGNIGTILATYIDKELFGIELVGLFDKNGKRAEELSRKLKRVKARVVDSLENLLSLNPKLVIEAASQEAVKDYATKILEKADLMIMSVGALETHELYSALLEKARERRRRVYIPSGAILGIDGIKAASLGKIYEVMLTTIKNPKSLEQTPYLTGKGIDLKQIKERTVLFEGCARDAIKYFPKNVNVAATLSYASIGSEKVKVRIIADPEVKNNIHEIYAKGDFGELYTRAKNVPSQANPKTSYLAALSAMQTLKQILEPVRIGT
ncbi:MAG: aspartate dehydrogenase [Candidatus Aenigmatarchaeota archaeon]|nr:MAG: aspartate dehydrogenase [Candidatus Aenigmarchaeota archaeon]